MSLISPSRCSPLRWMMANACRRCGGACLESFLFEQEVRIAQDGRHRRADFVAHVGQELALGAGCRFGKLVELLQLLVGRLQGHGVPMEFLLGLFRAVMFSWTTTARAAPSPENRVTRPMNQRFSVGAWHAYSNSNWSRPPRITARIPAAKAAASSASRPADRIADGKIVHAFTEAVGPPGVGPRKVAPRAIDRDNRPFVVQDGQVCGKRIRSPRARNSPTPTAHLGNSQRDPVVVVNQYLHLIHLPRTDESITVGFSNVQLLMRRSQAVTSQL